MFLNYLHIPDKLTSSSSSEVLSFKKKFFSAIYELQTKIGKLSNVITASHRVTSFGVMTTKTINSHKYAKTLYAVVVKKT